MGNTSVGEYKGKKTISLFSEGMNDTTQPKGYPPFSFGVTKAKLILENIEAIKKFVSENQ